MGRRAVVLAALVALFSQSAPQHRQRGIELLQQSRIAEAVTEFETALQIDPHDSATHFHLGRALLASGERDRAVGHLRLALPGSSDPGAVHYQLGTVWLASEDLLQAWSALSQAVALKPALRPASFALAEVCYRVGSLAAARQRLAALAEITPRWPDPEIRAAELALEQGDPSAAAEWLGRALDIAPQRPALWMRRGDALDAAFDHSGAETAYRRAVQLAPESATARLALAYHFFNIQRFEVAETELAQVLEADPADPSVLLPYAESLLYQGRAGAALAAVELAIANTGPAGETHARPDTLTGLRIGALELQARLLVKLGRLDDAERSARALLELSARSVQGHFVLGTVLQRVGRPEAAEHLAAFKRLSDAREHRELGDEYLRLVNDAAAAEREYRAALRIDPGDVGAQIGLGRALLAAGDGERAVATLEPLRDQRAGNSAWVSAWIQALHMSGREGEALAAWEAAQNANLVLGPAVWAITRGAAGVCDAPPSERQVYRAADRREATTPRP